MGLYSVKNQWGGSSAPWHEGGKWVIGGRPNQDVIALNVKSEDGGKTLTGTMIYRGEGPIGFSAIKESDGINAINQPLRLRIKKLETELKTQKEQYQQIIDRQEKAYKKSIENLKNVSESETKAAIMAAITEAKNQAEEAEKEILLARKKQKYAEVLSKITSKILYITESEDDTESIEKAIEKLVKEARRITIEAAKSQPDSTMAITAQNSVQQAIDAATTADQKLINIKVEQKKAKAALEEQKHNLERLYDESNNEEQEPLEVIEAAEIKLEQLEAEGGSLAEISKYTTIVIEYKEKVKQALLLATQQFKLASEAYDNWGTIKSIFGFSNTTSEGNVPNNSDASELKDPEDPFPQYDNWQVIRGLFELPAKQENSAANQTKPAATE